MFLLPKLQRLSFPTYSFVRLFSDEPNSKLSKKLIIAENQKKFFEILGKKLQIQSKEDWYKFEKDALISSAKGRKVLARHGSLARAIMYTFPDYKWELYKFKEYAPKKPKSPNDEREQLIQVGRNLGIKSMDEWYQVSKQRFREAGGIQILKGYHHSVSRAVMAIFVEHKWIPWKFENSLVYFEIFIKIKKVPFGYWKKEENVREYLAYLYNKLSFTSWTDWYGIKQSDFFKHHGGSLLQLYKQSPSSLLLSIYKEYDWEPWKFSILPKGYWNKRENILKFLETVKKELDIKRPDDWHKLTVKILIEMGAKALVIAYKYDVHKLLSFAYPELELFRWKFNRLNASFWDDPENEKKAIDQMKKEFLIQKHEDWYSISKSALSEMGFYTLVEKYGSVYNLVKTLIPDYEWNEEMFFMKGQRGMLSKVELILQSQVQKPESKI